MSLITLDSDRDVAHSTVENKSAFELTTLTGAQETSVNAYVTQATSTAFLSNAQSVVTTTPISATFRHMSNFFFSNTAGTVFPVAQDQTSTTSIGRAVQIGRTTMDDGIVSGTITAIVAFGTSGDNTYIDLPEDTLTGSVGRKGSMVLKSATTNIVGTVWYDYGTIIFHGGTGTPHSLFLTDSVSGFTFGAASAEKVVITQLSWKSLNVLKRSAFFCRAFNKEHNYTNNPSTIADQTLGTVTASLTAQPTTYISTVGLYNDDGDMMAVAKVSPPIRKRFDSEATLSVQLNF
jgi:hypothetical protein